MPEIGRNGRGQVTAREVGRLALAEGKTQVIFWHPDLPGLGLRVGKSAKTWFAQGRVPVGGRRRIRKVDIGRADLIDVGEALAKGREILGMMAQGIDPKKAAEIEAGRIRTLRGMVNRAQEGKGSNYGAVIEKYMPELMDIPLIDIDAGRVEARYRAIISEVAGRKHGPSARSEAPGVATANGVLRALSAVWNYVETLEGERHGIPPNPIPKLARVKAVRKTPVKKDRIESAKLGDFWEHLARDGFIVGRDAVALMLLTGLRRQSVCAMRTAEWDSSARMISFGEGRLKGKVGGITLPVSEEVAGILDRRMSKSVNGWMFPGSGREGYLAEPRSVLDRLMKKLDGTCNIHGLRRTFSSEAAFVMGEAQRKSLMVHAMTGVTQEVYTEIAAEDLRVPAQAVADRLLGYAKASVRDAVVSGTVIDGIELSEKKARVLDAVKGQLLEQANENDPGFEALQRAAKQ